MKTINSKNKRSRRKIEKHVKKNKDCFKVEGVGVGELQSHKIALECGALLRTTISPTLRSHYKHRNSKRQDIREQIVKCVRWDPL